MIGVNEKRKSSAMRAWEEGRHAICKIRRAAGKKIAVEDNKKSNIVVVRLKSQSEEEN